MKLSPLSRRARCLPLAVAAVLSLPMACAAPEPRSADETTEEAASTARIYTVQGVVRGVPTADRPGSQLSIRHQAIPDFVDFNGKEVGMGSMTMPFPAADDLSLEGITPGDAIEFDLAVDWDGDRPVQVTRVVRLPEGTEVDFGEGGGMS